MTPQNMDHKLEHSPNSFHVYFPRKNFSRTRPLSDSHVALLHSNSRHNLLDVEMDAYPDLRQRGDGASTQITQGPNSRCCRCRCHLNPPPETALFEEDNPDGVTNCFRSGRKAARLSMRIARQLDDILLARSQLAFEQQNLRYSKDFESESMDRLMSLMRGATVDRSTDRRYKELCVIYDQFQNDRAASRTKESLVSRLQAELDVLEYRLMKEAQEYARSNFHGAPSATAVTSDDTQSRATSTDVPSLLERYYERRGDAGVQDERLQELEDSYQEEKLYHDFIADRGDLTFDSDDLRLQYEKRRQEILHELSAARRDADELEKSCENAGIIIDRKPHSIDAYSDSESARSPDAFTLPANSMESPISMPWITRAVAHMTPRPRRDEIRAHESPSREKSKGSSSQVLGWIEALPNEPVSPDLLAVFQRFDIEALDLASDQTQIDDFGGSKADKTQHWRCYSDGEIAHRSSLAAQNAIRLCH